MQLNIPVHQTITLPDSWQACRTPQELSYWLIARLDKLDDTKRSLAITSFGISMFETKGSTDYSARFSLDLLGDVASEYLNFSDFVRGLSSMDYSHSCAGYFRVNTTEFPLTWLQVNSTGFVFNYIDNTTGEYTSFRFGTESADNITMNITQNVREFPLENQSGA